LQYDSSVRNSENTVVQFTYGDDGLHPDKMEVNDRPVDFERLRLHISQTSPCPEEEALDGENLMALVNARLKEERFTSLLPVGRVFLQEVHDYFNELAAAQDAMISDMGTDMIGYRTWNTSRITRTQLNLILQASLEKILLAGVQPGEAVGAIGAQSISEPGTQMTLKVSLLDGDQPQLAGLLTLTVHCLWASSLRRFTLAGLAP
jgi:DNA-directed RNA polymerase III subunit RPC1